MELKQCKCKAYNKWASIVDSGIFMLYTHGMNAKATKGMTFKFCPWCGKDLR